MFPSCILYFESKFLSCHKHGQVGIQKNNYLGIQGDASISPISITTLSPVAPPNSAGLQGSVGAPKTRGKGGGAMTTMNGLLIHDSRRPLSQMLMYIIVY